MTSSLQLLLGLQSRFLFRVACQNSTLYALKSSLKCRNPVYHSRVLSLNRTFSSSSIISSDDEDDKKRKPASKSTKIIPAFVNEKIRLLDVKGVFLGEMDYWRAKQKATKDELRLIDLGKGEPEPGKGDVQLRSCKLATNEEYYDYWEEKRKSDETVAKEITVKIKIADNELGIKINNVRKKLHRGPVKFCILYSKRDDETYIAQRKGEIMKRITKEFAEDNNMTKLPSSGWKTTILLKSKVERVKTQTKKWSKAEPKVDNESES